MYCSNCRAQIVESARFCPECGTPVDRTTQQQPPPRTTTGTRDQEAKPKFVYPKNPPLSPHLCWVNIFISGLAQMLHGQAAKGIVLLVVTIVTLLMFPGRLFLVIAAVSITDAFMVGRMLKRGVPVRKWAWFPS